MRLGSGERERGERGERGEASEGSEGSEGSDRGAIGERGERVHNILKGEDVHALSIAHVEAGGVCIWDGISEAEVGSAAKALEHARNAEVEAGDDGGLGGGRERLDDDALWLKALAASRIDESDGAACAHLAGVARLFRRIAAYHPRAVVPKLHRTISVGIWHNIEDSDRGGDGSWHWLRVDRLVNNDGVSGVELGHLVVCRAGK